MNYSQPSGIIEQLFQLSRRFYRLRVFRAFSLWVSIAIVFTALSIVVENYFYLPYWIKTGIVLFIGAFFIIALNQAWKNEQAFDVHRWLQSFQSTHPDVEALLNLWDLEKAADRHNPFHKAAVEQLSEKIAESGVLENVTHYQHWKSEEQLNRRTYAFLGTSSVLLLIIAGLFMQATVQTFTFWKSFIPENPYQYVIKPNIETLELGKPFQASIEFKNKVWPSQVSLGVKSSQEDQFRYYGLETLSDSVFRGPSLVMNTDFVFLFRMDGFRSEEQAVSVELLPRFEELLVTSIPPSYSGLDTLRIAYPYSVVEVLNGSRISISGTVNKSISTARIKGIHGLDEAMSYNATANSLSYDLGTVNSNDTLMFKLFDKSGLGNQNAFTTPLSLIVDDSASVLILDPSSDVEIFENDSLRILALASDDFGVRRLSLEFSIRKAFLNGETKQSRTLYRGSSKTEIQSTYMLVPSELGLEPLDEILVRAVAIDNDAVSGPKRTESSPIRVKIGSTTDLLLSLEEQETQVEESLGDVDDRLKQIENEFENIKQLLQSDGDRMDADQNIEAIEEAYEEAEKKINEIKEQFSELSQQLDKQNIISEETQKKYEELQQLIEQIDNPELMKALQELQKGLENLDQNQLRRAMENFEFNEEKYRERLERTIDLFKSLQTMAELEKAEQLLETLSKQEAALEQLEQSDSASFRQQQQNISEQLEMLENTAQEIGDKAPERLQDQAEQTQQMLREGKESIQEEIETTLQQMQKQPPNQPLPSTSPIQQKMQQLKQGLSEMKSAMGQQQAMINLTAVKRALFDLLLISESEEQIIDNVGGLLYQSPGFAEQARLQKNVVSQFNRVSDSLETIAREVPQLSNKVLDQKREVNRLVERTLSSLAERDKNNSSADLQFTLGEINELASMLADLIDQLQNQEQNGGGGGGAMNQQQFMQNLQEMGQQQRDLNQQIQQMINDMAGNRISQSEMERLNQMAKTQNQLRKQLEDLKRNGGLKPGDKTLSELERLGEMMEESINQLRGSNVDRLLINRQQNILSRMLEVEESMDKRDEDKKREGERPGGFDRAAPPELQLEQLRKILEQQLKDDNLTRYKEDYQELIRLYFELLQRQSRGTEVES